MLAIWIIVNFLLLCRKPGEVNDAHNVKTSTNLRWCSAHKTSEEKEKSKVHRCVNVEKSFMIILRLSRVLLNTDMGANKNSYFMSYTFHVV